MDLVRIENEWVKKIQEESNTDKELTKKIIADIKTLKIKKKTKFEIEDIEFSNKEITSIQKEVEIYNIPSMYVAYIDGVEKPEEKKGFNKNDVIFYVVDDSTDIVELMLNEYYVIAIYIIPKKYLNQIDINGNRYYKINNYKKLISISNIIKDYKKNDKIKTQVHNFILNNIIFM